MVTAHCMRCKKQVEMRDIAEGKTSKGTKLYRGKCPKCGTNICRIGGE